MPILVFCRTSLANVYGVHSVLGRHYNIQVQKLFFQNEGGYRDGNMKKEETRSHHTAKTHRAT